MTLHSPHAATLRLAGSTTAIIAALGAFAVRNAGLVHEWRICGFPVGCNYHGGSVSPLPTASVILPDGSVVGIWLYVGFISASGVLIAIAALACAARPWLGWHLMLCASAALLAFALVFFRLPSPTRLSGVMGPCVATSSCSQQVSVYSSAIPSVWYLIPAVALGVLTAIVGLLPSPSPVLSAQHTDWTVHR